jgi:hypothetical protein
LRTFEVEGIKEGKGGMSAGESCSEGAIFKAETSCVEVAVVEPVVEVEKTIPKVGGNKA